jgi:hypothetical protein
MIRLGFKAFLPEGVSHPGQRMLDDDGWFKTLSATLDDCDFK